MVNRTPVFKLLIGSGLLSICILIVAARVLSSSEGYYQDGTTTEYHAPATHDRAAAVSALEDAGFNRAPETTAADVFVPTFDGDEPIAIGTRLSHAVIDSKKTSAVHAAISILAQDEGATDRAPLNISLVIDRSGSMIGSKMAYARAASHALIDALDERDQLSIVAYGTDVFVLHDTTHVTRSARQGLHGVLDIECHGGTNISGGLERARKLVEQAKTKRSIDRVILLSDGRANEGIVDQHGLGRLASDSMERGVSVTTMGMGLDYDEDVLQAIASAGAGNYYFIEDGSATERVFADELGRLQSAVARNVRLHLTTVGAVTIVKVHGFPYEETEQGIMIPLDAFAAKERKDLLIEVRVPASTTRPLLESKLVYTDVATDRPVSKRRSIEALRRAGEEQLHPKVIRRVQQIRTLRAFQDAMVLYDKGDRFGAADLIERQQKDNRHFLEAAGIRDDAFERVDRELGRLAESLRKTERHSTAGKWISKSTKSYANDAVYDQVLF